MNKSTKQGPRILAIDPTTKAFAYVVFEGDMLIDWGLAFVGNEKKNVRCLRRARKLLELYEPDVIVLEDPDAEGCLRRTRARALIAAIRMLARCYLVRVRTVPRRLVQEVFSATGSTKEQVAAEIARRFPELEHRLPAKRKIWMAEDADINIFDAAALALTLLEIGNRKRVARRKTATFDVACHRRAAFGRLLSSRNARVAVR